LVTSKKTIFQDGCSDACTLLLAKVYVRKIAVYMILIHGSLAKKSSIESCVNIGC
jgi:hypothetical protein